MITVKEIKVTSRNFYILVILITTLYRQLSGRLFWLAHEFNQATATNLTANYQIVQANTWCSWCRGDLPVSFRKQNLNHADHTGHPAASVSQNLIYTHKNISQTNKAPWTFPAGYVRLAAALTSCQYTELLLTTRQLVCGFLTFEWDERDAPRRMDVRALRQVKNLQLEPCIRKGSSQGCKYLHKNASTVALCVRCLKTNHSNLFSRHVLLGHASEFKCSDRRLIFFIQHFQVFCRVDRILCPEIFWITNNCPPERNKLKVRLQHRCTFTSCSLHFRSRRYKIWRRSVTMLQLLNSANISWVCYLTLSDFLKLCRAWTILQCWLE